MELKSEHPLLIENSIQDLQELKKKILKKEKKRIIRDYHLIDIKNLGNLNNL
jgi:hypothetical protein